MTKQITWYKFAESLAEINFSADGLGSVEVNSKQFCIASHNGRLFACASKCPHASGMLADGYLDALGNIVCPIHRYKFSLQNGRNITGEGYYLKTYPIEQREDGLYIGL